MCGENAHAGGGTGFRVGSSPRVRGKRLPAGPRKTTRRLIPACAGKTSRARTLEYLTWAHPRVCGENWLERRSKPPARGSSPRVRGKRRHRHDRDHGTGLIPACAGKTKYLPGTSGGSPAHPRVCGENSARTPARESYSGSSPRVRGKHDRGGGEAQGLRLIPACAGKTGARPRKRGCWSAHPRVCGENGGRVLTHTTPIGSSPRVRGKLEPLEQVVCLHRLIPACAGKTRRCSWRAGPTGAHPRVCGENNDVEDAHSSSPGSSPRVRGKRRVGRGWWRWRRLIPACAGKTIPWRAMQKGDRAHPRVCGENTASRCGMSSVAGSSPRVRGKHERAVFGHL